MVKSIYMSGEQTRGLSNKKINVNILLKKIRVEEKKEQLVINVFFGLVAIVVTVAGVIVSL